MNITTEINDVFETIKTNAPIIVGIDGIDGVGKTSLAKDIEKLGYRRISLDDFLIKKSGGYFQYLDFDHLNKEVKRFSKRRLIIEGVLLQKVLQKLNVSPNYSIYITDNVWIYDWLEECYGQYAALDLKNIIKKEEEITNRLAKITEQKPKQYKMKGLRRELFEYTFSYRPWGKANVILQNN